MPFQDRSAEISISYLVNIKAREHSVDAPAAHIREKLATNKYVNMIG